MCPARLASSPASRAVFGLRLKDNLYFRNLLIAARAVMLAYEMAERAFQETGKIMAGVDKKAIADEVYRYLPDQVKRFVTQEAWSEFVQQAYDGARNLGLQFWQGFEKEFERWKEANAPVE